MVGSRVGMSKSERFRLCLLFTYPITNAQHPSPESADPEFDDYQHNFSLLETAADKFLKDTRTFTDAVNSTCRRHIPFRGHVLTDLFASTLHVRRQPRAAFLYPLPPYRL